MKLAREPFVHFLVLGALVFGLNALFSKDDAAPVDEIVVDDGVVRAIRARFSALQSRAPSDVEVAAEVRRWVREQALYREGLSLGLDRDDIVISRRLAQKVEFLTADLADSATISDDALRAYHREHSERFTRPSRVSFHQVFFSEQRRSGRADADAALVLARLRAGELTDDEAMDLGDPSLLPDRMTSADPGQVERVFGEPVRDALFSAGELGWVGPVVSAFGVHLVRVTERVRAQALSFSAARDQVRVALETERRRARREETIRDLLQKYPVRFQVEIPGLDPGAL